MLFFNTVKIINLTNVNIRVVQLSNQLISLFLIMQSVQNITNRVHQISFIALHKTTEALTYIDSQFDKFFQTYNFTLFCAIYVIVLYYVLHRWTKNKYYYRPNNLELQSFKEKLTRKIKQFVIQLPIIRTIAKRQLQKQVGKLGKILAEQNQKARDQRKALVIPSHGMTQENLKKRIQEWSLGEQKLWDTGKISGALYTTQKEHFKELTNFASKYMYHNPLHLDAFPELIRMESEVIKMTGSLLSKDGKAKAYGVITSGGSESLIMAMYAYKKYYHNRTRPNIVIPYTAHVALDKGGFYFNIQLRKAKVNQNFQVDIKHMESLIDDQTIMLVGSTPNYPHGISDPINQIAALGIKYNVGVHVDACLGGFVAAFSKEHQELISIERPGVTSVSLDQHKFALAPKGISTVFYKTPELRFCHYYCNTDWTGGLYGTFSMAGSRSGFASSGAWYSMTHLGKNTFKQNSRRLIETTKTASAKLNAIKGIKVLGKPSLCVLAFTTTQESIEAVYSYISKEKGWQLTLIQKPMAIHVSITLANMENVLKNLANDVQEALKTIREKGYKLSFSASLYGITAEIPTQGLSQDAVKAFVGATLV